MPQMGYDMQEGTVVRWLKPEGSDVRMGEPIAEIETDKAVVEFESYATGVLTKIVVSEGSTVPVGQIIAIVGEAGEVIADLTATPPETEPEAVQEPEEPQPEIEEIVDVEPTPESDVVAEVEAVSEALEAIVEQTSSIVEELPAETIEAPPEPPPVIEVPEPPPPPPAPGAVAPVQEDIPSVRTGIRASPVARRLADENGVSLTLIEGKGPGGRITKEDVLGYVEQIAVEAAAQPVASAPEAVMPPVVEVPQEAPIAAEPAGVPVATDGATPLSRMRQQIARVTVRSKTEKPHFYVSADIDMTDAMALRSQINTALGDQGVRVTVNDLIIKASVDALNMYPKFNAYYDDAGIRNNEQINVGIAMAVEEGLLMPAIMDCADKSLKQIASASKDLADRSQSGALRPQEYTGGTFSISNLGMFDVTSFVAIIQPPQSAILAVGTVSKKAMVVDDEVVVRQVMTATLSADHRVVDGAEGARFLIEVKRLLENPLSVIV